MALQRMILVPPELCGKSYPEPPPPVKEILKSKDHSYNKWTQVRLHQDPYLKPRNKNGNPFELLKLVVPNPVLKQSLNGNVPLFKTETESETDSSPPHSKYIHYVLTRKVSHDPTFGVYEDDTNGLFKIGRSSFKYNNKHVFVDGNRYKATQGLWELLTQSRPDKNVVTYQDRQAYKQILLQSNAHRVNYSPSGNIKANKGLKYTRIISQLFTNTKDVPWNR